MITVNEKTCVGCEACVNICQQDCIKMLQNMEGFYYPYVDTTACVNCGACNNVCIAEQERINNKSFISCYAAISKNDNERLKSSSGGVFSVLANYVLENNGVVYGAAFSNNLTVHHIRIDNTNELGLLRGSKYVQSHIDKSFSLAENDLKDGKYVLFTGTGCQIDALKLYLGAEYENLFW